MEKVSFGSGSTDSEREREFLISFEQKIVKIITTTGHLLSFHRVSEELIMS